MASSKRIFPDWPELKTSKTLIQKIKKENKRGFGNFIFVVWHWYGKKSSHFVNLRFPVRDVIE